MYIYIYIDRERDTYIYIYIYIHTLCSTPRSQSRERLATLTRGNLSAMQGSMSRSKQRKHINQYKHHKAGNAKNYYKSIIMTKDNTIARTPQITSTIKQTNSTTNIKTTMSRSHQIV